MSADEPRPDDDEALTPLLMAWEKALATGQPPAAESGSVTPNLQPALERGVACIRLLRQVLPRRPALPSSPDTTVGRYQVRRELGRGAFGVVFLAHDPQLGRDVALKVPRPEALLTPELRERFLREARAAAGLDHPNVVPVYEAGEAGPVCYIASAYCPGLTLAEWLRERSDPVPVALAARLVAVLAEAVQHAHRRGVIHRDLKPGNVLLQLRPESRTAGPGSPLQGVEAAQDAAGDVLGIIPKVTDFGLAKLTADDGSGQTQSGAVVGTPSYMAPEQASGRNRQIGPAADVYALGAILYELLVGRPPFRGESPLDTLAQVRSQEPVPPRRLRPKLPRDLETVCLKCLAKDPARRYASAAALADDLERFRAGRPILARPVRLWERGVKWARRRPAVAALLTVSGAAAVALLAVILVYNARLRQTNADLQQALHTADTQRQQAKTNLGLARQAIDDYATKVGEDPRLRSTGFETLRKELLRSAVRFYSQFVDQQADDPDLQAEQARACYRLAWLTQQLGAMGEAIDHYRRAQETFDRLAAAQPDAREYQVLGARSRLNLGTLYWRTGRSELGEATLGQACERFARLAGTDPATPNHRLDLASCYLNLGLLYDSTNRPDRAEAAYRQAQGIDEQLAREFPEAWPIQDDLAGIHNNLGNRFKTAARNWEAEEAYLQAQRIWDRLAQQYPAAAKFQADLAGTYGNLANVYQATSRADLAELALVKARDLLAPLVRAQPHLPDYQDRLAATLTVLADHYRETGRLEAAEAALSQARQIRDQLVQKHGEVLAFRLNAAGTDTSLGELLSATGQFQTAHEAYARSIRALEAVKQQPSQQVMVHRFLSKAYSGRALALMKLERYAEARDDWDAVLALETSVARDLTRAYRAMVLAHLGQHGAAAAEAVAAADSPALHSDTRYIAVCALAVCAAAAQDDAQLSSTERSRQADRYAGRAVELLVRARAAGYFREPGRAESVHHDKDLDALRARTDFQEFLADLAKGAPKPTSR